MKGFTLLEVIVALAIAALAAASLVQAAGAGLSQSQGAALYEQAIVRARSRLDAAAHGTRLVAGTASGDDGGGFHYQTQVVPLETVALQPPAGAAGRAAHRAEPPVKVVLYQVSVSVAWGQGGRQRSVRLITQQVGG